MAKYANPMLLILDEWLLLKVTESGLKDIFKLLHRRRKNSSTIFCSQYRPKGWYERKPSILNRIVHYAYSINIKSINPNKDISMREVYGLNKSLCK